MAQMMHELVRKSKDMLHIEALTCLLGVCIHVSNGVGKVMSPPSLTT